MLFLRQKFMPCFSCARTSQRGRVITLRVYVLACLCLCMLFLFFSSCQSEKNVLLFLAAHAHGPPYPSTLPVGIMPLSGTKEGREFLFEWRRREIRSKRIDWSPCRPQSVRLFRIHEVSSLPLSSSQLSTVFFFLACLLFAQSIDTVDTCFSNGMLPFVSNIRCGNEQDRRKRRMR